jgi:mannitol-specific phosphotransferase system IIBC component
VNLRVRLQMVEYLEYNLHELILSGYELLYQRVVVGVVGVAIAGLTIAQIVPCVHHLRDFYKRDISFLESKP